MTLRNATTATVSSPLYWTAVLVGNGMGVVSAVNRGSVWWGAVHLVVEVIAAAFWVATMSSRP